jgi:signal transduction histidine kinase
VTERRRLEDQLRQAAKLEAVGRLAAGVAHDFNNLLTAITGFTELVLLDLQRTDLNNAHLNEVLKAAERASELTAQLLAFGRKSIVAPRVLDLNSMIVDTEKMLCRLIGADIDLVTRLGHGLGKVRSDPGHLHQVIVNLAVNARDAMPDGGQLTIETANVDWPGPEDRQHPELPPGR